MRGLTIASILLAVISVTLCEQFEMIFRWSTIDFVWPSKEMCEFSLKKGEYVPANNAIAGIKVWKNKMYLTVPRWKDGVPVTLGVTSLVPVDNNQQPKLEAFPNWSMQKVGDCSAFQTVQSMEIDPRGRMWVLDSGRQATMTNDKTDCRPRLVILDLEKNGEVLRTYEFPEEVARKDSAYLNDIVLDHEDGGFAYISDSGNDDPGLIVYSLRNNTSWKIRHGSMRAKSEAISFMVAKSRVTLTGHINGLALSPASSNNRELYYAPLSSFQLYSISTSVLKNNTNDVQPYVKELGRKSSQTDGMVMSAKGTLYFGLLADDAVVTWDSKQSSSFITGQRVISRDHNRMQWPDTFAFDDDGNIYCVTNSLQNFLNNRVDVQQVNYRVIRAATNSKNYQYYENGSAPELPDVTAGAGELSTFIMASVISSLLVFLAK